MMLAETKAILIGYYAMFPSARSRAELRKFERANAGGASTGDENQPARAANYYNFFEPPDHCPGDITVRSALLLSAVLLPAAFATGPSKFPTPASAYAKPDREFALHLHVIHASRSYHYVNGRLTRVKQTGVANLLTDPSVGITYGTTCGVGFSSSHNDTFYEAKWKKPNEQLEILVVDDGKTDPHVCTLDVVVRPEPYTHDDNETHTDDQSS
jgi:hypothetical protein